MVTIFGIKNCNIVRRTREWLDTHEIVYRFHDYRVADIEKFRLEEWVSRLSWETLLNRAGITFLMLPDSDRLDLTEKKAVALMLAQPSMIKRPVLEAYGCLAAGFRPEQYEKLLVH